MLAGLARDCCGGEFPEWSAIVRWPETRRWVNAHPIGVAVMQAPVPLQILPLTRFPEHDVGPQLAPSE